MRKILGSKKLQCEKVIVSCAMAGCPWYPVHKPLAFAELRLMFGDNGLVGWLGMAAGYCLINDHQDLECRPAVRIPPGC